MSEINPDYGDWVTFYDGDGEPERAIVVDPVDDAEYITIVTGKQAEFQRGYNHDVESHSSVYPHADHGEQYTSTTHAFKLGWGWDDADE